MSSIEIRGVDELIRKLGKIEGVKILEAPMQRSVDRLQRDLADYDAVPKMKPGEWAAWVNNHSPEKARQIRGAYWAKVNRTKGGKKRKAAKHPGRTGTLGKRWKTRIRKSGQGLTGTVGNNTKYAPFVQSQKFQARLHQKRWKTDQQAAYNNRNAIVADFEQEIRRALQR